jgi:RNA polymerase sigma factor (sigma-70 family)
MRPIEPKLEELLEHASWLKNLARSLVRDPDLADDLVQQTWVTALEHPPQSGGNLKAWLGRVLRNNAYSRHRAEQRRLAHESQGQGVDAGAIAHEVVERGETSRLLVEAVMRLEEPYRSTLLMRYHDEMTPKMIAEQLGVPASTVRARLKRGLEKLRVDISQSWGREWNSCNIALLTLAGKRPMPLPISSLNQLILPVAAVLVTALLILQPWSAAEVLPVEGHDLEAANLGLVMNGGAVHESSLPTDQRTITSTLPADELNQLQATLMASDSVVEQSGYLRFGSANGDVLETAVTQGRLHFDSGERDKVLSPEFSAWFVPDQGFALEVLGASLAQVNGEDELQIDLGQAVHLSVHITDLDGNPIPNANLSLHGAYQPPSAFVEVAADGHWQGRVIGRIPSDVVVRAMGFDSATFEIAEATSGQKEIEVKLSKVIGVAQILDRRESSFLDGSWKGHQDGVELSIGDLDHWEREVQTRFDFDPEFEFVVWRVITEKRWKGQPYRSTRSHPHGLMPDETMAIPGKHLGDPDFQAYRFPGEWPHDRFPVDVRLAPLENFKNGQYPHSVSLQWQNTSEPGARAFSTTGKLLDVSQPIFRFFLPIGNYNISTTSTGPSGLRKANSPRIDSIQDVIVGPSAGGPPMVEAHMSGDEFFASYLVTDEAGVPINGAWNLIQVIPNGPSMILLGSPVTGAKQKLFTSGSEYELHLADRRRGGMQATGIHIVANSDTNSGLIKIVVPRPQLLQFRDPPE